MEEPARLSSVPATGTPQPCGGHRTAATFWTAALHSTMRKPAAVAHDGGAAPTETGELLITNFFEGGHLPIAVAARPSPMRRYDVHPIDAERDAELQVSDDFRFY